MSSFSEWVKNKKHEYWISKLHKVKRELDECEQAHKIVPEQAKVLIKQARDEFEEDFAIKKAEFESTLAKYKREAEDLQVAAMQKEIKIYKNL